MEQMTEYMKKQMEHTPTRQYYEGLRKIYGTLKPQRLLEIGTGWGISGTAALESGVKELVTVDPNNDNDYGHRARMQIESAIKPGQKVNFIAAYSRDARPKLSGKFDVVYIDGDHCYEACFHDLQLAEDFIAPGGWIVLDDVLHPGNWAEDPNKRCGVTKAVRDFVCAYQAEMPIVTLYPTNTNGFGVIEMPF